MALDGPRENEETYTVNGVNLLIDNDAQPHMPGKILDYITSPQGDGFVIQPEGGQSCC